jgi:hypothetical protein
LEVAAKEIGGVGALPRRGKIGMKANNRCQWSRRWPPPQPSPNGGGSNCRAPPTVSSAQNKKSQKAAQGHKRSAEPFVRGLSPFKRKRRHPPTVSSAQNRKSPKAAEQAAPRQPWPGSPRPVAAPPDGGRRNIAKQVKPGGERYFNHPRRRKYHMGSRALATISRMAQM